MNFLYAYFKPHQWLPHRVSSPNQTDRSHNANWKRQDEGLVLLFERTRGEGGDRDMTTICTEGRMRFFKNGLVGSGKGVGRKLCAPTPRFNTLQFATVGFHIQMKVRLIYEIEINSHTLSEKSLDYSNSFVALH